MDIEMSTKRPFTNIITLENRFTKISRKIVLKSFRKITLNYFNEIYLLVKINIFKSNYSSSILNVHRQLLRVIF